MPFRAPLFLFCREFLDWTKDNSKLPFNKNGFVV